MTLELEHQGGNLCYSTSGLVCTMISEPDKATKEMNGTSVKSENIDIKDEIKEEAKSQTTGLNDMPNHHSGPPSNKLTNGDSAGIKSRNLLYMYNIGDFPC